MNIEEIVKAFISRPEPWHAPRPNVYHASKVLTCFRRVFYEREDAKPEREPPYGIFEMGRRAEDVIFEALQHKFGKERVKRGIEVTVQRDGFEIVGRTDPGVYDEWGVLDWLFEVKSSSKGKFAPTEPFHLRQVSFYAKSLKPKHVVILHPSRNDALDLGVRFVTSVEIDFYSEDLIKYFERLHEVLRLGDLPPPAPFKEGECDLCPFYQRCKGDGGW